MQVYTEQMLHWRVKHLVQYTYNIPLASDEILRKGVCIVKAKDIS
jgi:hypothetical protein